MKIRTQLIIILCLCTLSMFACAFAEIEVIPQGNQPPQMGGGNGGQPPEINGENGMGGALGSWNSLFEDGVIDEDTLNAVEEYLMSEMPEGDKRPNMSENGEKPQMPEDGNLPPMPNNSKMPEPAESFDRERPAMPEGEKIEGYPGITVEILDALLENEIIDKDTYDIISTLIRETAEVE